MHSWDGGILLERLLCYESCCNLGDSNGIKKNKTVERWQMECEEEQWLCGNPVDCDFKESLTRWGSGLHIGSVRLKWPDRCSHIPFSAVEGGIHLTHTLNGGTGGKAWKSRQRMESSACQQMLRALGLSAGLWSKPCRWDTTEWKRFPLRSIDPFRSFFPL